MIEYVTLTIRAFWLIVIPVVCVTIGYIAAREYHKKK